MKLPHKAVEEFKKVYNTAKAANIEDDKFQEAIKQIEKETTFDNLLVWCHNQADSVSEHNELAVNLRLLIADYMDIIYENW